MEFTNCRATNVDWISIISGFVLKYGTLKITCFIIIVRISIVTIFKCWGVPPIFRHIHIYIYCWFKISVIYIYIYLKLPQISDDSLSPLWLLKYNFLDTPSLCMTHRSTHRSTHPSNRGDFFNVFQFFEESLHLSPLSRVGHRLRRDIRQRPLAVKDWMLHGNAKNMQKWSNWICKMMFILDIASFGVPCSIYGVFLQ